MMDCYDVLGVRRDASQDEIKEAFRERALECHPDRAAEGEERAAEEEFVRVRKAFELLSDPQKRAAYDSSESEKNSSGTSRSDVHVRRRSYEDEWRSYRHKNHISVSRVILDRVGGLSADHDVVRNRTSMTVPLCSLLGTLFFLFEPSAIYATDVFLVDLFFCTALGGIYGFVIGSAWGYVDVYLKGRKDAR